jgi:N-acetylmuramoyl-L-alanine amidase
MGTPLSRLASVLLLAAALAAPAFATDLRGIRLWAGPDSTRVVLDLSGAVRHSVAVLQNPDRVVIDVDATRLAGHAHKTPSGAGPVTRIRVGRQGKGARQGKGTMRVVLDLAHAVRAKSFLTPPNDRYGYRLVIDLYNTGSGATPALAALTAAPIRAEHAPADGRDLIIAVDAGHGGDDPGAIGKNGTREKDVVLAIARELARRINAEPGMRAVLTRGGDYFVTLRDRMQRARAQKADLFVSVHADSIRDRRVDGSSVYILSPRGASDEAARWLAERENASDLIGGVSLDDKDDVLASVLLDLSQSAALSASEAAAEQVLRSLNQVGEVRKRQVQQARFVVLKSPDIPSMLVETAYISNPAEERRLRGQNHQSRLAAAIHQGVRDYFYANPPAGTRIAQLALATAPHAALAAATGDSGT